MKRKKIYKIKPENCTEHLFLTWLFFKDNDVGRVCEHCGESQTKAEFFALPKDQRIIRMPRMRFNNQTSHIDLFGGF